MAQAICANEPVMSTIEKLRVRTPCSYKRSVLPFPAKHWALSFDNPDLTQAVRAAEVLCSCGYRAIGARQVSDTISVIFARCGKEGMESIAVPVPLCRATNPLLRCPRGLLLAILGPDGVGKSSISLAAVGALAPFFDYQRTVCWRPQLIRSRIAKEPHKFKLPHDASPYGPLRSILKLTGAFADFFLDHATATRNQLRGCSLIVWDRYIYDIAVDAKRYLYSGPSWYSDLLLKALPVPEQFLGIVLDANSDLILNRKRELPIEELERQRLAYCGLAGKVPHTYVVRNESDFHSCLQQVLSLVIGRMAGWFEPVAREALDFRLAAEHEFIR